PDPILLSPRPIGVIEHLACRPGVGLEDAAVGEEVAQRVLLRAVARRRRPNLLRDAQPLPLPGEAALDGPREDGRTAERRVLEDRLDGRVAGLLLHRVLEGDAENAPPDRPVAVAHAGGIVRRQPELELRDEIEELAEEEAGGYGITPGQMLDES